MFLSRRAAAFALALVGFAGVASADPRPFTFTTDAYPIGKGDWEFEQWITYRHHKDEDAGYNRVDFREEFEFGVADNVDLAFYLPNWTYEDSKDQDNLRFDSVGAELVVYFTNPVEDPIGLGLYNEINVGEDEIEFETKLIVQKDIGNWIFAYNLVAETALEGTFDDDEENEVEGELKNTFGVAYALDKGIFVGGEAIIENSFEDWSEYGDTHVYAGPVVSFQNLGNFWVTVTPTFLLTQGDDDEADVQLRVIAGYQF
jgi:hypothetical protein